MKAQSPWIYDAKTDYVRDADGAVVAKIADGSGAGPIIALAPELADALRDVLGFLEDMAEDYSDYGIPEKRDRVRALLSRLD